jgi:hypothetical protein
MDLDPQPDPAIFVTDLQDANKNPFFSQSFRFSAYYFLKVHLHHFSKIKVISKSQNIRNPSFFLLILLDDRRIRIKTYDSILLLVYVPGR